MRFITLEPEEFRKFANKSPYKSFMQTIEIAKLREKNGWTAYYFGVDDGGKLIAAAMAVARPTFLGKSTYYVPGGPLLDYEDTALVDFFFKHLKNYAKSHNGYLLHIEPYYELIERDRDGEAVQNGFNHQKALQNLRNLGFHEVTSDNPKYLFVLDLTDRKKDELFASFKQNTRNLISRTARKGVKVRELGREELNKFKQITTSTSKRRHFSDRSLDYYETMYDLFAKKGEVKFLLAEVEDTPVAVAMFMTYGDEVIYLFSGSDEKYMKEFNAQYAIQWYMLQYALDHKCKRYNFYGIQGLPNPNKPGYGIYKFKKGFGGHVVELLGAYEAPTNSIFYTLHRLLAGLKSKLHH